MSGKLPYSASRVIKASKLLADGAKLVWLEDQIFDRGPEGAYISAGTLAQRLGCSRETIERHRRELVSLDLHRTHQRQRGETASWFCCLPPDCIPSHKPGIDDVTRLADRLDAHIAGIRRDRTGGVNPEPRAVASGGNPDATPPAHNPQTDATMAARLTPLPALNKEAKCTSGWRTSPTSGRRTTNLLPQDGELQDGERLDEDRGFENPDLRTENDEVNSGIPMGDEQAPDTEFVDRLTGEIVSGKPSPEPETLDERRQRFRQQIAAQQREAALRVSAQ